jgi:TldD protein
MGLKYTRRDFLGKSSKSLIAAAFIPSFLNHTKAETFSLAGGENLNLQEYLDHFNVNEKMIQDIISAALSRGGDYCDLYFQHTIRNYIGLEDKLVNRAYSNIDFGVGIRVLKGDQTGYSFTEEVTLDAMMKAAKTAASIAESSVIVKPVKLTLKNIPSYYRIETPWEQVGIDKKIPYLQTINEKVFAEDKRIIKSNVMFSDETSYIMLATSDGIIACDYQPMGQISVSCNGEQNGRREENYFDLSGRRGIDFFTPANIDRLAKEAVRRTVELFDAVKPEAGEMPVVLAAGSSGILLHEAIGHGMEADFNRKNASIFSDKINKPVAEKFVSIVDDGTMDHLRGSINIDDEGNSTEKTYLVENGILRSYLHDRISAQHYKVKPTGSGRRESFRFSPLPRMRNTYMLPGPHTKDEIIAVHTKGYLC